MHAPSFESLTFAELMRLRALHDSDRELNEVLRHHTNHLLSGLVEQKDAAMASNLLGTEIGQELLNAALVEQPVGSLLDALLPSALMVPDSLGKVVVWGGTQAEAVDEGGAKVSRQVDISTDDLLRRKIAAMTVTTKEFAEAGGQAARRLLTQSLTEGLNRRVNQQILGDFDQVIELTASGDAETDLKAGIAASDPATAYVVLCGSAEARALALSDRAGPGMSVNGGVYVPGITIVADPEYQGMAIVPASRVAIRDDGLDLRNATHASVLMTNTPAIDSTTPTAATLTSLWQTNCVAVLLERSWRMLTEEAQLVVVGGGS